MLFKNNKYSPAIFFVSACLLINTISHAQTKYPTPVEGDYIIKDFAFVNGEKLASLNLHYTVIGKPQTNKEGKVSRKSSSKA